MISLHCEAPDDVQEIEIPSYRHQTTQTYRFFLSEGEVGSGMDIVMAYVLFKRSVAHPSFDIHLVSFSQIGRAHV